MGIPMKMSPVDFYRQVQIRGTVLVLSCMRVTCAPSSPLRKRWELLVSSDINLGPVSNLLFLFCNKQVLGDWLYSLKTFLRKCFETMWFLKRLQHSLIGKVLLWELAMSSLCYREGIGDLWSFSSYRRYITFLLTGFFRSGIDMVGTLVRTVSF